MKVGSERTSSVRMIRDSRIAVTGHVLAHHLLPCDPITDAEKAPGSTEMSPNTDSNGLSRMFDISTLVSLTPVAENTATDLVLEVLPRYQRVPQVLAPWSSIGIDLSTCSSDIRIFLKNLVELCLSAWITMLMCP